MQLNYISSRPFNKSFFKPVRNNTERIIKPEGGLWTSPVTSLNSWEAFSCESGIPSVNHHKQLLHLTPCAKIITVTSAHDLARLPFRRDKPNGVDWEILAKEYDAFWLTSEGMLDTILSDPHLCGWDCETVLVMNPYCIQ